MKPATSAAAAGDGRPWNQRLSTTPVLTLKRASRSAALVAGFIWLMTEWGKRGGEVLYLSWTQITWITFAFTLYAGLSMVTNAPFYSFKDVQMKKSVPFAVIVLIALGIAIINIHPPIVLFGAFVIYGFSGYGVYAWRKFKGVQTSVISTSKDEPDERGLHK